MEKDKKGQIEKRKRKNGPQRYREASRTVGIRDLNSVLSRKFIPFHLCPESQSAYRSSLTKPHLPRYHLDPNRLIDLRSISSDEIDDRK